MVLEKVGLLKVKTSPKPASESKKELDDYQIRFELEHVNLFLKMWQQAVGPKYFQIIERDVNFFKSFGHDFVDEIERIRVARSVAHHQVGNENVVLSVTDLRLIVILVCLRLLFV